MHIIVNGIKVEVRSSKDKEEDTVSPPKDRNNNKSQSLLKKLYEKSNMKTPFDDKIKTIISDDNFSSACLASGVLAYMALGETKTVPNKWLLFNKQERRQNTYEENDKKQNKTTEKLFWQFS